MKKILFFGILFSLASAQDTITFQWPVPPFNSSQPITGTFCEFRNTLSSNHFHNGTDIPNPDGNPVYPSLSGTVNSIGTPETDGTSAYVRVRTQTALGWKHISYVHINPNPALTVGSPVTAGITVLGTTLTGQGHTHLTERQLTAGETSTGVEIGAWRNGGGLTPYVDTYPPQILWVRFFQNNSSVEFADKKIYGRVDIISQMVEKNGVSASSTNNGVYQNGYKILSADGSTVVYNPPADGTRYKFDYKPIDTYANVVFTLQSDVSNHIYYLTNGNGNQGISTSSASRVVNDNYFDSSLLPAGTYQVMVFAKDTRGNADTLFVPFEITTEDLVAPARPVFLSVLNDSTNRVTISWQPNTEPDLKGYYLYFSNNEGKSWQKHTASITNSMSKMSFTVSSKTPLYFKMTAYDSAAIPNESPFSDSYGIRPNVPGKKILIVDAFDRTSGSYTKPQHDFSMTAGLSIGNVRFETCHNSAVTGGSVLLSSFDAVVWMFGDEGSTDETFGSAEQAKAIAYLQQGGKIFANGSEIAYDLDRPSGPSVDDRNFLHTYLKSFYAGDASGSFVINGSPAGGLNGLSFSYGDTLQGSPYAEDYPDYLTAAAGVSFPLASYANALTAAVEDNGMNTVLLGVPFETIHTKTSRDAVMAKILESFGIITTSVRREEGPAIPERFSLEQNFPNPFNPSTTIGFSVAEESAVAIRIYDILGREVATLVNERLTAGTYTAPWNAGSVSTGVYIVRMDAGEFSASKKILYTK